MTAKHRRVTRQKFFLGAIVVRAGLSNADRAFLLGGLLQLARVIPGSAEYQRLRDIGEEAFKHLSPDAVLPRTNEETKCR